MRKNARSKNETCMLIRGMRSRTMVQANEHASFILTSDILLHYFNLLQLESYL